MKNLFGLKKQSEVEKPATKHGVPKMDNPPPPPAEVSGMPVYENPPPPPPLPKVWKSYRTDTCKDATSFLNENGIDPAFMIYGHNNQIFIFFKE